MDFPCVLRELDSRSRRRREQTRRGNDEFGPQARTLREPSGFMQAAGGVATSVEVRGGRGLARGEFFPEESSQSSVNSSSPRVADDWRFQVVPRLAWVAGRLAFLSRLPNRSAAAPRRLIQIVRRDDAIEFVADAATRQRRQRRFPPPIRPKRRRGRLDTTAEPVPLDCITPRRAWAPLSPSR